MFEGFLESPLSLLGVLIIIPLIILYFLKPKPKQVKIPTLMFLKNIEENKKLSSLFDKLIKDPLLFTQILFILLLVISLANPFILSDEYTGGDVAIAIVLDASASMQSTDIRPSRFSKAVDEAQRILLKTSRKSSVSIILAENIPITALDGGSVAEARALLAKVKPADTPSNIGDSIILAKDMLVGSSKTKIMHVLSDFSYTEGMDPALAKKIASLNEIKVNFIEFSSNARNVGIIDFSARRSAKNPKKMLVTVTVRNYVPSDYDAVIRVYSNKEPLGTLKGTIDADSDSFFQAEYSISDERQSIRAELGRGDDFTVDNFAMGIIDDARTLRTLLISSAGADSFLKLALQSLPNNILDVAEAPVIPSFGTYDIIVMGSVSPENIPPGTFRDISLFTSSGGAFIIIPSDYTNLIVDGQFYAMLPVALNELVSGTSVVYSDLSYHEIIGREGREEIGFSGVIVSRYFKTAAKNNTVIVVSTGNYPLIAYRQQGLGKILYMGLNPDKRWSNFRMSADFPILLYKSLRFLSKGESYGMLDSYKSGEYLTVNGNATVTTPDGGTITSSIFFLDDVGLYRLDFANVSINFTVNLLNSLESNLSSPEIVEYSKYLGLESEGEKVPRYYWMIWVIAAVAVLFVEAFFYKRRGLL